MKVISTPKIYIRLDFYVPLLKYFWQSFKRNRSFQLELCEVIFCQSFATFHLWTKINGLRWQKPFGNSLVSCLFLYQQNLFFCWLMQLTYYWLWRLIVDFFFPEDFVSIYEIFLFLWESSIILLHSHKWCLWSLVIIWWSQFLMENFFLTLSFHVIFLQFS